MYLDLLLRVSLFLLLSLGVVSCGKDNNSVHINYDEPWRKQYLDRQLCAFFTVGEEERSMALLDQTLKRIFSAVIPPATDNQKSCNSELSLSDKVLRATFLSTLPFVLNEEDFVGNDAFNRLNESLLALRHTYNGFHNGTFRVYEADQTTQVIAYEIRSDDARIYVVINFSYDIHPLPLPLGFMASTKIKLWRTDDPEIKSFVTRGPLSIRAMTAAIVIVD